MSTYPTYAVTTDIILFTIRDERLKLLLIRRGGAPFQGQWALPGGFVNPEEALEAAALRELAEETNVRDVYLEQLYTFGAPGRDPRGRIVTVAYFALMPSDGMRLSAATDAEAVGWFALDDLPPLAFDHAEIVEMAHQRLVAKLDYSTLAFQFLPTTFTLSEVQQVYETILGHDLDKRNFRKWALALDQLEETGEMRSGAHRPARLYRLKAPDTVAIIK